MFISLPRYLEAKNVFSELTFGELADYIDMGNIAAENTEYIYLGEFEDKYYFFRGNFKFAIERKTKVQCNEEIVKLIDEGYPREFVIK